MIFWMWLRVGFPFSLRLFNRSHNFSFYLLNLPRDLKRQVQRAFGGFAADHRGLLRADAFDEMLQFELERFVLRDRHRLAHDFFAGKLADDGRVLSNTELGGENFFQQRTFFLAVARDAIDESFLHAVIERDVAGIGRAAEDADLAHPLRADAAGGEIGDAAVGKPQSHVGDVLALAQHGNAHAVHAGHGRFHKRKNHVEIVDHQIEHDADVRAARGKWRQAMALDELRFGGNGLKKSENRIEPLDVADLQDEIFLLREFAQFGGLLGTVGHRLLDEDMFALCEQLFGDVKMRRRGRDDVQRVARVGGLGDGGEDAQLMFLGDFFGGVPVRIVNAGEFNVTGGVEFGINAGVMLTEGTSAEHGDFDFCHARSLPVKRIAENENSGDEVTSLQPKKEI